MVVAMADGNVAAGKPALPHASRTRQSKRSFPAPEKRKKGNGWKPVPFPGPSVDPMIDKDPQMIR